MEHATRWHDASVGAIRLIAKGTPYIPLDYVWKRRSERRPVWADVIDKLPRLANGWRADNLRRMMAFLKGEPMIFDGFLKLLPAPASKITIEQTIGSVKQLLDQGEEHVLGGRIPVLKPETKALLLERAERHELRQYGRLLEDDPADSGDTTGRQKTFFD